MGVADSLRSFINQYGGEALRTLKDVEEKDNILLRDLHTLDLVREDPKFHGDVSSLEHSLRVVTLLEQLYATIFKGAAERSADENALLSTFALLERDAPINAHLETIIGTHQRKELLFFACIFHDIGKLKNFTHLMEEVDREQVKGVARFIFHNDFGRLYFVHEEEELDKAIKNYEEKLAAEQHPTKKKFYMQALEHTCDLKKFFSEREAFFKRLALGEPERQYISFVISKHMDLLNFYNQFRDAFQKRGTPDEQKLLATYVKNMVKKTQEYGGFYYDCILLSFCDVLESMQSAGTPTKEAYLFLRACLLVGLHKEQLLIGVQDRKKGTKMIFEGESLVIVQNTVSV